MDADTFFFRGSIGNGPGGVESSSVALPAGGGNGGDVFGRDFDSSSNIIGTSSCFTATRENEVGDCDGDVVTENVVDGERSWSSIAAGRSILDTIPKTGHVNDSSRGLAQGNRRLESAKHQPVSCQASRLQSSSHSKRGNRVDFRQQKQEQQQQQQRSPDGCIDDNDMVGRWEAASSEDYASVSHPESADPSVASVASVGNDQQRDPTGVDVASEAPSSLHHAVGTCPPPQQGLEEKRGKVTAEAFPVSIAAVPPLDVKNYADALHQRHARPREDETQFLQGGNKRHKRLRVDNANEVSNRGAGSASCRGSLRQTQSCGSMVEGRGKKKRLVRQHPRLAKRQEEGTNREKGTQPIAGGSSSGSWEAVRVRRKTGV